ncbi:NAD-dependent epimerase/dehydratase family protein [Thioclava sp. A2]|uniref:NAD-dependent epimerase/dehydratase family protein n=1 Tax=Thioclava sp. FCG-A2 TaxID=3080562 RepID=UPI00295541E4|nr:NAD-dependent epimerase/dehydratase family protein [Thioclava sp. A2]MDV7270753.1 NAD-dependent epimerase/dehydratase family protein [Thioclava sp. A2]
MKNLDALLNPAIPRILILGGTGRVGGLLRRAWGGRGGHAGLRPVWQGRRAEDGVDAVFDPLENPEALKAAVLACDAVLNLAGTPHGSAQEMLQHRLLAEAARDACAGERPLIVASSAAVYGATEGLLSEDLPLAPVSAYGLAKQDMEAAVAGIPRCVAVRIGNIAGADALLGQAPPPTGYRLHVLNHGETLRRSYIGPQALAFALARLARLMVFGVEVPPILNIALPGAVSMAGLLEAAGFSWADAPAPSGAIATVELDVSLAIRVGLVPEAPATPEKVVEDWSSVVGAIQ